ncbi:hypothetical protein [Paenibacillus radicis (ex Xue et al. 2023)]|uniref:Uncharacterized protein n=1 Tax=Paenibacillus radicis (ex Xue et al. 2023) TaxID=2972489 RepID=A0ABT1YRH6_9BACL|nr:hypothetical protein [Paenibacillus radicis (ex Xue et al. 2023)]MCR8635766.1 hypothetical protein [Paenibacillus radicis (ex Xue et al. 2023)]
MKKTWKWLKISWLLFYILGVTFFIAWIGYISWATITDKNAIENSRAVNTLSIVFGIVSLPAALIQLISLIDLNSKKEFKVTTVCPHCRHKVDLTLKET